ncbi:MAG: MerR family transcriptional regulator [Propionibacteriaceae bacterium]|nr:MerR family transcriptional regulator [Propionibacteriaceae bacterium]
MSNDTLLTVGQLAKRMGTTVRTLQYYDQLGLLEPSEISGGGRRLYSPRDVVRLHQIQTMKYLGFSLGDIKTRLVGLTTPADVANELTNQAAAVRAQIESLNKVVMAIEALLETTLKMDAVDWSRYADVVTLLRLDSEMYWAVTQLGDRTLAYAHAHFTETTGKDMIERFKELNQEIAAIQADGAAPDSEAGLGIAAKFWGFIMEFTGGDASLLPELLDFNANRDGWDATWKQQWEAVEDYISAAMNAYFAKNGQNPFEGIPQ